jgi:hypothetical protein
MVLMNLGIRDRPFVPHNLISAQESPVPLPKLQMAPRLKIFVPWVQKRTPDILSKKSQHANPVKVPQ